MPLDNVQDRELNPPSFYDDSLWEDAVEICYYCDEELEEPIEMELVNKRKVYICQKCKCLENED